MEHLKGVWNKAQYIQFLAEVDPIIIVQYTLELYKDHYQ